VFVFGYYLGYTERVKTAISLPDETFRSADRLAKRLRLSRSELYARAVAIFVKGHEAADVTQRLNHVYADGDEGLDPLLARMQTASLEKT
jgi:predicted transcriptional regulator